MNVHVFGTEDQATAAATQWLSVQLIETSTKNVMVAGGNTPLALYAKVAERKLPLGHLTIFALDEYVGVPQVEPRNCANLIRRAVVEAWTVPPNQYRAVSSCEQEARSSIADHEKAILSAGGLDLVILGLGQNGHIGFNEPGSDAESIGRVLPLNEVSVEANRRWFGGDYAPKLGVTTGMQTILAARCIMILAFGSHKSNAVFQMIEGLRSPSCPASYLQSHPNVFVFLDEKSASQLTKSTGTTNPSGIVIR